MTELFTRKDTMNALTRVVSDLSDERITRDEFNRRAKQGDYTGARRGDVQGYVDMRFGKIA
jgi:hypothetical protein